MPACVAWQHTHLSSSNDLLWYCGIAEMVMKLAGVAAPVVLVPSRSTVFWYGATRVPVAPALPGAAAPNAPAPNSPGVLVAAGVPNADAAG